MRKFINPESRIGQQIRDMVVVKHLGMREVGKFFNKKYKKYYTSKTRYYLCKCVNCGDEKETRACNIKLLCCTKCKLEKRLAKKGHPLFNVWIRIVYENYRKSKRGYKLRSKGSVKVCEKWLTSFENFKEDVGSRPAPEYLLKRIDINLGFTPENFIWRKREKKEKQIIHKNRLTLTKLSKDLCITYNILKNFVFNEIKNEQSEINNYIDKIQYRKTFQSFLFKPEAIEYFKVNRNNILTDPFKSKIKEYYLKGIDIETTAKELNKTISTILRYYTFLESEVPNISERLKDPETLVGKRIGKTLILKHLGMREIGKHFEKQKGKYNVPKVRFYLSKCEECGLEKEITLSNIGRTGCRGCGRIKPNCRSRHPLFGVWNRFITSNYRKINGVLVLRNKNSMPVCDRWLSNFYDFVKDIAERPNPKYCFARIDRSKGYSLDNCKWMTRKEWSKTKFIHSKILPSKIADKVGLTRERVRQIINTAFSKKDAEFINLCESIEYTGKNRRVTFKPEAIEYFKNKKYYRKGKVQERKLEMIIKLHYLEGNDIDTLSDMLMKPARIVERYYKKFDAEKNGTN